MWKGSSPENNQEWPELVDVPEGGDMSSCNDDTTYLSHILHHELRQTLPAHDLLIQQPGKANVGPLLQLDNLRLGEMK